MVIEALKSAGLTRFQVTIGEVDYFRGLCEEAGLDEDTEKELRSCISGKNFFAAQELLEQKQIPEPYHSILLKLADMFENIESLEAARHWLKMKDPYRRLQDWKSKRTLRAVRCGGIHFL